MQERAQIPSEWTMLLKQLEARQNVMSGGLKEGSSAVKGTGWAGQLHEVGNVWK